MCIICLSLDKETITINEASELFQKIRKDLTPSHAEEVGNMLWGKSKSYSFYEPDFKILDDTDLMWLFDPTDGTQD